MSIRLKKISKERYAIIYKGPDIFSGGITTSLYLILKKGVLDINLSIPLKGYPTSSYSIKPDLSRWKLNDQRLFSDQNKQTLD